jgi:hypothetical protein
MAIKTPATVTPPPNSVPAQGEGFNLYRSLERHIIDDGTGEVNFADALCKLNDPGSGEALNVNVISGGGAGVAPIPNFRATTLSGRKVLFEANFDTGFDTLNDFNCAFDGTLLPESRDESASTVGVGSVTTDVTTGTLYLQVHADSPDKDVILSESKNYIKIPLSGVTYLEGQGVFEHQSPVPTTNTTTFALDNVGGSLGITTKDNWNVDTFDGSADANNPSEILLDFTKLQTAVFQFSGRDKGGVKFGFIVDDTLYFAHVFKFDNSEDKSVTLNLPIRDELVNVLTDKTIRSFGLHNQTQGYTFGSIMDTTNEPALLVEQYLKSVVCYTVGADPLTKKIPFNAGNKETYIDVTAADTPLFSLQCADTFKTEINRSVFNFDSLRISTSSQDANFGCYIKVFYNTALTGASFVALPDNAESALEYDITATAITGGIEIFSTPVMANQVVEFSAEDIFKSYRRAFSHVEIDGFNITTQTLKQTLTVVASPMQGVISTTAIDVSANIFGGEVG